MSCHYPKAPRLFPSAIENRYRPTRLLPSAIENRLQPTRLLPNATGSFFELAAFENATESVRIAGGAANRRHGRRGPDQFTRNEAPQPQEKKQGKVKRFTGGNHFICGSPL